MKKKIFVGNLSWKATEDQLRSLFEAHGTVLSVKIITDQYTGKSKGFGFVEMEDADAADKAIRELNDKPLLDRNMRVSLAQERTERTDRPERRDRDSSGPAGGHNSSGARPYRPRMPERNY